MEKVIIHDGVEFTLKDGTLLKMNHKGNVWDATIPKELPTGDKIQTIAS